MYVGKSRPHFFILYTKTLARRERLELCDIYILAILSNFSFIKPEEEY